MGKLYLQIDGSNRVASYSERPLECSVLRQQAVKVAEKEEEQLAANIPAYFIGNKLVFRPAGEQIKAEEMKRLKTEIEKGLQAGEAVDKNTGLKILELLSLTILKD